MPTYNVYYGYVTLIFVYSHNIPYICNMKQMKTLKNSKMAWHCGGYPHRAFLGACHYALHTAHTKLCSASCGCLFV